jgi:hypothetical protein
MRPRNWLTGIAVHLGLMVLGLVMATPWLRKLVAARVVQPGEGPEVEVASWDEIEYRGVGRADEFGDGMGKGEGAICRAWFRGSTYYREFCVLGQGVVGAVLLT